MTRKPMRANLIIRIAFTLVFIFLFVSVINLDKEITLKDLNIENKKILKFLLIFFLRSDILIVAKEKMCCHVNHNQFGLLKYDYRNYTSY